MTAWVTAQDWHPPPQAALFGELTRDGSKIILIGQGGDDELRRIAQQLQHLTPLVKKESSDAASVPATWAAVSQLAHTFTGNGSGARWVPGPALSGWITEEWGRRTAPPAPLIAEFPPWLKLRPYQEEAAARIAAVRRFLLLDEPGTGKTASTIAGLAEIQARGGEIFPAVIVVPSWDVADGWQREIATWMPGWRTVLWGGPGRDLGQALDQAGILITTYATATLDADSAKAPLVKLQPATVVCDEFHFMKNNTAKRSVAVRRITAHAANVIELSGTPVTRDTGDTYPAADALCPGAFPDRKRYVRRFCETSSDEYGETIQGLNGLREPEFRTCLLGQMRRVAKADVLTQLPPKIYSVRRVGLPERWRKAYDQMEADMLADLPDDGGELSAFATVTQMMFLARMASSAGNATVTEEPDKITGELKKHYHYEMKAPSWKADALMEILAERPGYPVAAYSPYKPLMMIAGRQAEAAGLRVGYITGPGDGITNKTRLKAREDFQAGRLDLIACTTGAGGTGITLSRAGTLVFLQRPWPLGDSIQTEDRAHRIGSEIHEHGVQIIDIVGEDTVDSRIRERLTEKGGQLAQFCQDIRIVRELLGGLRS